MLPAQIDVTAFDALQADPAAWHAPISRLAARLGGGPLRQTSAGTVLVALLGHDRVLKLYPPFLRDHCMFERATLALLQGRLAVPTPRLLDQGDEHGWPWILMDQLAGTALDQAWPALPEADKCSLLQAIGALASQAHALPAAALAPLVPLAPHWPDFLQSQRSRCLVRQQRCGLPEHLLRQLDNFLQGELPEGPAVLLTGEYTPMNLLVQGCRLVGMYDFGDGLLGPREYDWLGPLCFLAAGHPARCAAFMAGCGATLDEAQRLRLLRLLLLHRYSNLPAQIACPGWQAAPSFEALAQRLWA